MTLEEWKKIILCPETHLSEVFKFNDLDESGKIDLADEKSSIVAFYMATIASEKVGREIKLGNITLPHS